jgi:hypothetical protein
LGWNTPVSRLPQFSTNNYHWSNARAVSSGRVPPNTTISFEMQLRNVCSIAAKDSVCAFFVQDLSLTAIDVVMSRNRTAPVKPLV